MSTQTIIEGRTTVNEAIRRYPSTVAIFNAFGIDACCGGGLPIGEAAERHGIDPAVVLEAVRRAADAERG